MGISLTNGKKIAIVFAALYIVVSLIFSFSSISTWDDDCVGRYYNTVNSFNHPEHFISLWNRPLFTVLFAIPLQFGKNLIPIMMVLISFFGAYYLYKALRKQEMKNAYLVIPLILFQTYFFSISRNAETEPMAVALFCFGYYFMVEKKWYMFALMAGLLPLARLELAALFPFWGLILLKEKQLKPILMMLVPLFVWNMAAGFIVGDFNYVYNNTFNADNTSNRYGHSTFGHYFQRYIYVVGPFFFFFFAFGMAKALFSKLKFNLFIFLQFCAGFFIYVMFSWKLNMGNSAGFMRHITPITALSSVIALWGFNYWHSFISQKYAQFTKIKPENNPETLSDDEFNNLKRNKRQAYKNEQKKYANALAKYKKEKTDFETINNKRKKIKTILFIGILLFIVLLTKVYFTLEMVGHQTLKEDTVYNTNLYVVGIIAILSLVLLFIKPLRKISPLVIGSVLGIAMIVFTAIVEPPDANMSLERITVAKVSDDFQKGYLKDKTELYINHSWFFWANDLNRYDEKYRTTTMANLDSATIGSICIWENHYSHRLAGDVKQDYFAAHNKEWVNISMYITKKTNFKCFIYEKIDSNKREDITPFKNFQAIDPTHVPNHLCLAQYYSGTLKMKDSAIAEYDKAILLDDKDINSIFNRGIVHFSKKDNEKAQEDFLRCIHIKSNWAYCWLNLGATYSNQKKIDSSIIAYTQAIKLDNKLDQAYLNRGRMYHLKKDTAKTLSDFSNYLSLKPQDFSILMFRAKIYFSKKKYDYATSDLKRAVAVNPNASEPWFVLGVCQLNLKLKDEARKSFENAQKLGHPAAAQYIEQYCN